MTWMNLLADAALAVAILLPWHDRWRQRRLERAAACAAKLLGEDTVWRAQGNAHVAIAFSQSLAAQSTAIAVIIDRLVALEKAYEHQGKRGP